MRIAAKKSAHSVVPMRDQLASERLRTGTLRSHFPEIERVCIELIFADPAGRSPPPSPQLHTLYAAAPAFFRFVCPCADCDGAFDLTEMATKLITNSTERKRAASHQGRLSCQGLRFRGYAGHQAPCSMEVNFQLRTEPHRAG
jgi:hypothetical protein